MKGFADKALLILPSIARVGAWEDLTWFVFNRNITKLAQILREHYNMEAHIFNGSPLIDEMTCLKELHIVESVPTPDVEFLRSYGLVIPQAEFKYPHVMQKVMKKYPLVRGLSREERLSASEERERYAEQEIIKSHYKVIMDFEFGQDTHLNLHPKPSDGKIICQFGFDYRVKKSFMNGVPMYVALLLNNSTTGAPIESWRF